MPRTIRWDPPKTPFTLDHVAPLGVTPRALRTAVQTGRVVQLVRGVHVSADALPADESGRHLLQALARQLLRPHSIASHHTAALAWGLPLDDPLGAALSPAAFTEPWRTGERSELGRGFTVSVRDLPPEHRVAHPSGLLVTSLARTAVDVAAAERSLPTALIVVDAAARQLLIDKVGERGLRHHYTRPQSLAAARRPLLDAAEVAATQFTRGRLAEYLMHVDPRRESPLESFSFGQMVMFGVPLPALQTRICTPEGDLYPDFLWADAMVIGEADGMVKYQTSDDLRNEKRRQERLERMGFLVVRWEDRDVRRAPGELMARLMSTIEARSHG